MIKRSLSFLLIVLGFVAKSQTYPYLNASTANENEFPVDKDTNIYMFHDNRLVKTDKNFNVIWANTYSGITRFSRLLLSKTGSIYCLASSASGNNIVGKLGLNGNVLWFVNTATIMAVVSGTSNVNFNLLSEKLMLDRNNNLVVTGGSSANAGLIKLDTNGTVLKFKMFGNGFGPLTFLDKFSIIDDSLGCYKIVGGCIPPLLGPNWFYGMSYYNDATDQFLSAKYCDGIGATSGYGYRFITSKFNNNFYVQTSTQNTVGIVYSGITKLNKSGKPIWRGGMSNFNGTPHAFSGYLTECDNGDLFYQVSSYNFLTNYSTGFLHLDSNGVNYYPYARPILFNYPVGFSSTIVTAPRTIKGGNHYYDITGQFFSTNPLTVQKFTSSLTSIPCLSTMAVNYSSGAAATYPPPYSVTSPTIVPITFFNIPSYYPVAASTSFSVNTNFCTVLNVGGVELNNKITLSPNPTHSKINIDATSRVELIEVFDISGKLISKHSNTNEIDVTEFSPGMYFIRMNIGNEIVTKKFIKE